jgi:hypothetical protein
MPTAEHCPEPVTELDEDAIAAVAGGINPQPLPPRHETYRLD